MMVNFLKGLEDFLGDFRQQKLEEILISRVIRTLHGISGDLMRFHGFSEHPERPGGSFVDVTASEDIFFG